MEAIYGRAGETRESSVPDLLRLAQVPDSNILESSGDGEVSTEGEMTWEGGEG